MATLNFKGKSAVWNHHLSVPYHTFDKDKTASLKGKNDTENLIIEGDNLLALKALLPKYQGKVKCIYIDPPYNTGNEGWVYNDNVGNPVIADWIGQVVGKEGEDLTRHDKWLAMMTPRLKLLRELLSDDGVIFVSIDDNELGNLRTTLDEVFGLGRFMGMITWINRTKPKNMGKAKYSLQQNVEYVLCYSKCHKDDFLGFVLPKTYLKVYPYKKDGLPYRLEEVQQRKNLGSMKRDSMVYELFGVSPKEDYRWQLGPDEKERLLKDALLVKEKGRIYQMIFKKDEEETAFEPFWSHRVDTGTAESAKESLEKLLQCDEVFDNVKPVDLLKQLFIFFPQNTLFLDSFAGSGTTAQAVLELNKEDGGNRKFILVQIPEKIQEGKPAYEAGYRWVHEITRDRVKKVIARDGLDVGFTYYTLGPSINARDILAGKNLPKWESFAKYAHFLATGKPIDEADAPDDTWEIVSGGKRTGIYALYEDDVEVLKKLAITRDWLEKVKDRDGKKIVYAPACFLDKEILDAHRVSFVQIPFGLFERK